MVCTIAKSLYKNRVPHLGSLSGLPPREYCCGVPCVCGTGWRLRKLYFSDSFIKSKSHLHKLLDERKQVSNSTPVRGVTPNVACTRVSLLRAVAGQKNGPSCGKRPVPHFFLEAGQMSWLRHSLQCGLTGRQICWPKPTSSQLISLQRSLGEVERREFNCWNYSSLPFPSLSDLQGDRQLQQIEISRIIIQNSIRRCLKESYAAILYAGVCL